MWSRVLRASGERPAEVAGGLCLAGGLAVLLTLSETSPSATRFYVGWFGAWAGLVLSIWPVGRRRLRSGSMELPSFEAPSRERIALWFGLAVLLRLLALGFEPALSDDVYRYVWDGRVALSGADPYATSPDDEALIPLRDELWQKTAHREVESVYPPLAQVAFAVAASFERPVVALRATWLGFDLATCWLLFVLVRRLGGSRRAALLYLWNPLVVVEGVGMGHVDVFGVFWLMLAVWCGVRVLDLGDRSGRTRGRLENRSALAVGVGVALAAGALVKLVPLVLIPVWVAILRSGRLAAAAALTLVVGTAPVWLGVGVPPGLLRYGISWEFNGLLFEPLWRLLDGWAAADRVKSMLAWAQQTCGFDPASVYPYVYPQFLAKLVLGTLLAIVLVFIVGSAWSGRPGPRRAITLTAWSLLAATAVSATLYPWYLLWLAALLPLVPSFSLIVLCATMGFAYLPKLIGTTAFPAAWALVWLPALTLAIAEIWWRRRVRRGPGKQPRSVTT